MPADYVKVGNKVLFTAGDAARGVELWVSDGTEAGTRLIKDLAPGHAAGAATLTAIDGKVYFAGNNGVNGYEPWVSDGTPEGTRIVADLTAGSGSSSPIQFLKTGSKLYVLTNPTSSHYGLWSVDLGTGGASQLKDFGDYTYLSTYLIPGSGDTIFFRTYGNSSNSYQLWASDGTVSGTKPIFGGLAYDITPYLDLVFFIYAASDSQSGGYSYNLYSTSATPYSTTTISVGGVTEIVAANGGLFYNHTTSAYGTELYFLSNTVGSQTVRLIDILPGSGSSSPTNLTAATGGIYFAATGSVAGQELWFSDGTAVGTYQVKDVNPGGSGNSASISSIVTNGRTAFFAADDGVHGKELWFTDGTMAGTHLVRDINVGSGSATIADMRFSGNQLFFTAIDGTTAQLWSAPADGSGAFKLSDVTAPVSTTLAAFTVLPTVTLGGGGETLVGTPDDDFLIGLGGDDVLTGGLGNDVIDGGSGVDTAVFSGSASQYVLTRSGGVTIGITGPDGTDTLTGIERLQFADATLPGMQAAHPRDDFAGDFMADIVWRNSAGDVRLWSQSGATITADQGVASVGTDWRIAAVADLTGDGRTDFLWRNRAGDVRLWTMQGAAIVGDQAVASVATNWKIEATGDFDGDGKADLLWRNAAGDLREWKMDGASIQGDSAVASVPIGWSIAGIGDFDADGHDDIVWRGPSGEVRLWEMNGAVAKADIGLPTIPNDWTLLGVGDFGGDGRADMLWESSTGAVRIWDMNGGQITNDRGLAAGVGPDWHVQEIADFNNDGRADILWRSDGGAVRLWKLGPSGIASDDGVADIPTNWTITSQPHDMFV